MTDRQTCLLNRAALDYFSNQGTCLFDFVNGVESDEDDE